MITLIGIAHVFDVHDRLRDEIRSRRPEVVAVELDKARYEALGKPQSSKGSPLIYRVMAYIQKRIGEEYGVVPGSEMKVAVDMAREIGASVAFIDLPATYTFKRLMDAMTFKEKVYLVFGVLAGLFIGKKKIDEEMENFQENEESYMQVVEKNMPSIARVLIDERNTFMARNIVELERRFGDVVAIVGDGHARGLIKELEDKDLEVIRLKEMMKERGGDQVNFSFSYDVQ
ncbi:MAG: TraB/GumN family protein [Thermoplasmata archaeon]